LQTVQVKGIIHVPTTIRYQPSQRKPSASREP